MKHTSKYRIILTTVTISLILLNLSLVSTSHPKETKMKRENNISLKLTINDDLVIKVEMLNRSGSTLYFLYDTYERLKKSLELHIVNEKGKKIDLPEIITVKYSLKKRRTPYDFTEVKDGESATVFETRFKRSGDKSWAPQYKRLKINTTRSYDLPWRAFHLYTGIMPGKYRAFVTWDSTVEGWIDEKTGELVKKKGAFKGKLKSNKVSFTLP